MSKPQEHVLTCNGTTLRYLEAGKGEAIVLFPEDNANLWNEAVTSLTARYRVIAIETPPLTVGSAYEFATALTQALAGIGVTSCNVIGVGQGTGPALALASAAPTLVKRVVLLSPPLPLVQPAALGTKLREITVPALVLVGTRDRSGSREAGHLCREQMPTSYLLLIYEAGNNLLADRREACLAPINEFLERGEGFIVFQESQMVHS
jgi:pimeloyl-ACP methyl ester carboxylesterase